MCAKFARQSQGQNLASTVLHVSSLLFKVKARIWPRLSYTCHVPSTVDGHLGVIRLVLRLVEDLIFRELDGGALL